MSAAWMKVNMDCSLSLSYAHQPGSLSDLSARIKYAGWAFCKGHLDPVTQEAAPSSTCAVGTVASQFSIFALWKRRTKALD